MSGKIQKKVLVSIDKEGEMRALHVVGLFMGAMLALTAGRAMAAGKCVYDDAGAAGELGGPLPPEPPPTHPAVLDGFYNRHFAPCFPAKAYRAGIHGTVSLAFFVIDAGQIREVKLEKSSGYTELDEGALDAARHWRAFAAASRDRVPYGSWVRSEVNF